ncbi:MAG TPA: PEP/pyruvate-binding domain-containing protein [Symbiobacteriaceae bacterium]|nr:PEP/pyruvate-binding domain-containing protein [Symbiobacteriaceae bacterium]
MIRSFRELTEFAQAGGKGAALARLVQSGYPVPEGYVLLPSAFAGDALKPEAAARLRVLVAEGAWAVRSSALSEDSARASFAGEFETVLGVKTPAGVLDAVRHVRQSTHADRVKAYSEAQNMETRHEMAVVVQRMVHADLAGVLFTADPVSGSRTQMTGNYVHGLGEQLVSGEANAFAFTLARPQGRYAGPAEFAPFARRLFRLAARLERETGLPQDIEWAVAGGRLYILQARPVTTLKQDEWNDSLSGDYLWTNANLSEALPDVMTPATWSLWRIFHVDLNPLPPADDGPLVGNIGGRPYMNLTLLLAPYQALGLDPNKALEGWADMFGRVPAELAEFPPVPRTLRSSLQMLSHMFLWELRSARLRKRLPGFVKMAPTKCRTLLTRIDTTSDLATLWQSELQPYILEAFWMLRCVMKVVTEPAVKLRRDLVALAGEADAGALLSGNGPELASLGPLLGLARVATGELTRAAYLEQYGHRSPHEAELAAPRPAEDPTWFDQQPPLEAEALLARRGAEAEAAWQRLRAAHPARATAALRRRIDQAAEGARLREAVRSEVVRVIGTVRAFLLKAGQVTGLNDDIFFLTLSETERLLNKDHTATARTQQQKEAYARYSALPPLPTVIRGRFDPMAWAADPHRRSDWYDSHRPTHAAAGDDEKIITGFPGAAGRVAGTVRVLHRPEDGAHLQKGEILVTATTNVGWTPLFPRAAAIVTDVGAPLSHAAIVARELGVPAVVGCGNATMRLKTGDRVIVDGGRGCIEFTQ